MYEHQGQAYHAEKGTWRGWRGQRDSSCCEKRQYQKRKNNVKNENNVLLNFYNNLDREKHERSDLEYCIECQIIEDKLFLVDFFNVFLIFFIHLLRFFFNVSNTFSMKWIVFSIVIIEMYILC